MAIDPQFEKIVKYLTDASKKVADGSTKDWTRPWINFQSITAVEKFDFEGVHKLFTRQAANDAYGAKRSDKNALAKDIQSSKLTGDYLAGWERDYRMRTRSRVRMIAHTASRMAANGDNKGPLVRNSTGWIGNIMAEDKKK